MRSSIFTAHFSAISNLKSGEENFEGWGKWPKLFKLKIFNVTFWIQFSPIFKLSMSFSFFRCRHFGGSRDFFFAKNSNFWGRKIDLKNPIKNPGIENGFELVGKETRGIFSTLKCSRWKKMVEPLRASFPLQVPNSKVKEFRSIKNIFPRLKITRWVKNQWKRNDRYWRKSFNRLVESRRELSSFVK